MLLLHCMAVDHYGQSFTIALCFLNRVTQANYNKSIQWLIETVHIRGGLKIWPSVIVTDYELALTNVIDILFSALHSRRILCRWHIMKNLTVRFKAKFETDDCWIEFETAISIIISAKMTDEYLDTIQEIQTEFQSSENLSLQTLNTYNDNAISQNDARIVENMTVLYVLVQWFGPHKDHIVSAWVDRQLTLKITTSLRIERGHQQLEDWIGGLSSSLQSVTSRLPHGDFISVERDIDQRGS